MATKLIVDTDDVRSRMSLPDNSDINAAIDAALTSAHVFFASALGTPFEENIARFDIFYLDPDRYGHLPNKMFRLRLKQAFVMPGSVSVFYADSRPDVLSPSTSTPVNANDWYVDYDKGIVFIDDLERREYMPDQFTFAKLPFDNYRRKYIRVVYSAGFGGTTKLVAPDWLKEAVLMFMPGILITKSDDIDKWQKTANNIRQQAAAMVQPYKRETVYNFMPIY